MQLRGEGGRLGSHGALGRMPQPLEEQEGLGDRRVVQEPHQTLSSPHLGCGAVSTYLSARSPLPSGLPSTSPPWVGFSPLLPAPSFHCPPQYPTSPSPTPPTCSAQRPPLSCWKLAPTPPHPTAWTRRQSPAGPLCVLRASPVIRKPISDHFTLFHFAFLPPM